jgi:hypothetical protein
MVTTEQASSKHRPDAAADDGVEQLEEKAPQSADLTDSAPAASGTHEKEKG